MGDVALLINGQKYLGWEDLQISRSLEALSGTFSLSYIDAWDFQSAGRDSEPAGYSKWYIKPGDQCEITIDDELVLTGFIDEVQTSFDEDERRFQVSGRDKTGDLVDCSAAQGYFKSYKDLNIAQLAVILCKPFGIKVINQTDVGKIFRQIAIEHSQSVHDVLEQCARQRAVLMTTDKAGNLVFTNPGSKNASTSLEEGDNILSGSFTYDFKKRHSRYYVYGQSVGEGQFWGAEQARKSKSSATDPNITRYRPKVLIAERDATRIETKKRADWEASFNAARGSTLTCRTLGWRQGELAGDPLWETNMLVRVKAPSLGVEGEMLIESVTFRISDQGEVTDLQLTKPDAYTPNPVVKNELSQFLLTGPTPKLDK